MGLFADIEELLIAPFLGRNTTRRASGLRTVVVPARTLQTAPANKPAGTTAAERATTSSPGASASQPDRTAAELRRTVYALEAGTVTTVGWQVASDHAAGMGWRIYVTAADGSRIGYGHMDPKSTSPAKTVVKVGDAIGFYADPTNGHSSGPHVHVQKYDKTGKIIDPGKVSPLKGASRTTSSFHVIDNMHKNPHQGTDWVID